MILVISPPETVYKGNSSYIHSVKWKDFVNNKDSYLAKAEEIRDK